MKLWSKQKGFTIVELLIVIVVIAVLAAITIVAYNGIQIRASNTATISSANSFAKLVKLYIEGESKPPANNSFCQGENLDTNSDGIGDCAANGSINQSDAANSELKKYGNPANQTAIKGFTIGGNSYRGVAYYYNSSSRPIDGTSNPNVIVYYLQGDGLDCANPNVLRDNGGTSWSSGTGDRNTYSGGGRTSCYAVIK